MEKGACAEADGRRSKCHLGGTRSSEARDHRHRHGLLLLHVSLHSILVSLRSSRVSHRVVQHQRGKEVVGAHVGELGALLVDRSPTNHSAEVVLSSARERVVKLEAALAALGDACGPEVVLLQSSLKSAKRAAQEPALDVQLSQCEQFVARAQKRLAAHDEERVRLVSELQEGES